MCGIVGILDKTGNDQRPTGAIMLAMLQALACRGPDGAGLAMLREHAPESNAEWLIRIVTGDPFTSEGLSRLENLGRLVMMEASEAPSFAFRFLPAPGVSIDEVEVALGAKRGGLEVLSLGTQLDLVKQVGSPDELEGTYGISRWQGPVAIGHTRMSTESKIDLSHSQPFWAHGVADLATSHNGHITNYHQLRRKYEQQCVTFYTDNDSEVIGVYLRDRLNQGRTLAEALKDSIDDLDGAFNYLVVSSEGLGVVRDRYGFKPLMMAETEDFVAFATEEIALRRALPGRYKVSEPRPGHALFFPLATLVGA